MVNKPPLTDAQLDAIFFALANPIRRAIIVRLGQGSATVAELGASHDVSGPAITKHLKVLERADLLQRTHEGRVHRCSIDPEPMQSALAWIEAQRTFWEDGFDRLAKLLDAHAARTPHPHPTDEESDR